MKNTLLKKSVFTLLFGAVFAVSASTNFAKAQSASNEIQEVKLSNDGFNTLRNLIAENFNFTNPDLTVGEMNSTVAFHVSQDGRITDVKASGDCKYVDRELENVMNHLLYRVNRTVMNKMNESYTYTMPVSVLIASR